MQAGRRTFSPPCDPVACHAHHGLDGRLLEGSSLPLEVLAGPWGPADCGEGGRMGGLPNLQQLPPRRAP